LLAFSAGTVLPSFSYKPGIASVAFAEEKGACRNGSKKAAEGSNASLDEKIYAEIKEKVAPVLRKKA